MQGTEALSSSRRGLLRVMCANTAAMVPMGVAGPQAAVGQVLTASPVTELQGQDSNTAMDRGKGLCFQNEACK